MEEVRPSDQHSMEQPCNTLSHTVRIEVVAVNKLGKDLMRVIGTVCNEDDGQEGGRFVEGDSVAVLFDRRGAYQGDMSIAELKAKLALPRGKDKNASMNAYLRFLTVRFGKEEATRTTKGAIVVHAAEVLLIAVEPEDDAHSREPNEKEDKEQRHRVFCDWALETFGKEALQQGSGVIDVAGGTGHFARMVTKRHPHIAVSVLDLPEVVSEA